jgi:hypothetical protein
MTAPCWLGIDLSTQSVTVALLPDDKSAAPLVVLSVVFERDLPHYNTTNGMYVQDGDHPADVSAICNHDLRCFCSSNHAGASVRE